MAPSLTAKKPLVLGVPFVCCYMQPLFFTSTKELCVVHVACRPLSSIIPYSALEIDEFARYLAIAPIPLMFVCSRNELNVASCTSRQQKQPFLLCFHQSDACVTLLNVGSSIPI